MLQASNPHSMRRVLLLQTMGGQRKSYQDAAARLGVDLRVYELPAANLSDTAIASVTGFAKSNAVTGCLAVDARAATVAAAVTAALALPGNPPAAAGISRNKLLTRERLRDSDLLVPWFFPTSIGADPSALASMVAFPCVLKPLFPSDGRGVMRADDAASFVDAFARLREQLASVDADADDAERDTALIEGYIDGWEFVLVGVMHHGALHAFALIDKPDPLEGPQFQDTIYVVPSLAPEPMQWDILDAVSRAAASIGLRQGPVRAECRVSDRGVYVLGVAPKPLDAAWAAALRFQKDGKGALVGYEDLLLRHALGESPNDWRREPEASGVMKVSAECGYIYSRGPSAEAIERELRQRAVVESRYG
ncbi:MAG TPA: ATP-grasp domain-containing protein [Vicinamibacterales bacterium]|nr:ATP-grasp domain-containing protein [Vicinamibacterales bacterium]